MAEKRAKIRLMTEIPQTLPVDRFRCQAIKKNRKPSSGKSQQIVMLQKINRDDNALNFRSVLFPKLHIFVEMLRRNLQSPV